MRIAIISDIHDNVWNLAAALDGVRDADVLICCGDLCSPFVVDQLARGFPRPIHIVFGNNDGDLYRITDKAIRYGHVKVHGEFFQEELDGKRIAVNHYNNIAAAIAPSGQYDVVCYGHNHLYKVEPVGKALTINPGALMGAKFEPDGTRVDIPPTFVVYDTSSGVAQGYQVITAGGTGGGPRSIHPFP
jgi:putative phosphoesterase